MKILYAKALAKDLEAVSRNSDIKKKISKLIETLKEGFILTNDKEVTLTFESAKIQVMPVWKWLRQTECFRP